MNRFKKVLSYLYFYASFTQNASAETVKMATSFWEVLWLWMFASVSLVSYDLLSLWWASLAKDKTFSFGSIITLRTSVWDGTSHLQVAPPCWQDECSSLPTLTGHSSLNIPHTKYLYHQTLISQETQKPSENETDLNMYILECWTDLVDSTYWLWCYRFNQVSNEAGVGWNYFCKQILQNFIEV